MDIKERVNDGYRPTQQGVMLWNLDDFTGKSEALEAVSKLGELQRHRPKSIVVELQLYRKYVPLLVKCLAETIALKEAMKEENDRFYGKSAGNSNKRWTKEEDELLIEEAAKEDATINEISITFGRTPSAIAGRITYLVGRKRISQAVAGRFVGFIDGEKKESEIVGTVYKK